MAVTLDEALLATAETDEIDFKKEFDPSVDGEWCELLKDILAMGNSGGGDGRLDIGFADTHESESVGAAQKGVAPGVAVVAVADLHAEQEAGGETGAGLFKRERVGAGVGVARVFRDDRVDRGASGEVAEKCVGGGDVEDGLLKRRQAQGFQASPATE